jgi:cytochrome c oxidase subunit 1
MFVTGMNPMLGQTFQLLTLIISVPAEILFLNWLHTIWKGSNRFGSPMWYTLGDIFVFGLGGLTGLPLGTILTDLQLHDTMFVVGHFHLTMASASFLGSFGALTFWFPKMFGRKMDERMAKAHALLTTLGLTGVFVGQLIAGYAGHQRRLYDPYQYNFLHNLLPLNRAVSWIAFALIAAQVLFVINFFKSIWAGEKATANVWEVGTLEWTNTTSPPPHHNFDDIPTVHRGPHEFNNPDVKKVLGKDWIGQSEDLPTQAPAATTPGTATA